MATCKNCGRSGLFLSLTRNGLCRSCNVIVAMDVEQRARIIKDSVELVEKSKKLETRLSRCDLLIDHAGKLADYEERGIPTIDPSPSQLIREYRAMRDDLIVESLTNEVALAEAKADLATTTAGKVGCLSRMLLMIREYKPQISDPSRLSQLEHSVADSLHSVQLKSYLTEAEKAEFKKQYKKAASLYYDALYFLQHDEIDDSLQAKLISTIEGKIAEMESKDKQIVKK